jgi:hypothetical protein
MDFGDYVIAVEIVDKLGFGARRLTRVWHRDGSTFDIRSEVASTQLGQEVVLREQPA